MTMKVRRSLGTCATICAVVVLALMIGAPVYGASSSATGSHLVPAGPSMPPDDGGGNLVPAGPSMPPDAGGGNISGGPSMPPDDGGGNLVPAGPSMPPDDGGGNINLA